MHPVALNYKISNKQITIEHNFIQYSYSYMVSPPGWLLQCIKRSVHPVGSKHVDVWILYNGVIDGYFDYLI
jgi:hypothetical protein